MDFNLLAQTIATVSGIGCVYLQTKEKMIAWPLGILSVGILSFLFYRSELYSDLLLHILFIILNFYGWWSWLQRDAHTGKKVAVKRMTGLQFFVWFVFVILFSWLLGSVMRKFFGADLAYFDAFTTSGSLAAQYLLAKKYRANWIFWIIVDVVAIVIYLYKALYMVSFLFLIYLILSIVGYQNWSKSMLSVEARSAAEQL